MREFREESRQFRERFPFSYARQVSSVLADQKDRPRFWRRVFKRAISNGKFHSFATSQKESPSSYYD